MEPLLKDPVQQAYPHALPFRVIFEEHRRRRNEDLLTNARDVFAAIRRPPKGADTAEQLLHAIRKQENVYKLLEIANAKIADGSRQRPLDNLVRCCRRRDEPLKKILHLMDASAVCLSGGGIRSATFSLGILEGLSRYSTPGHDPSPEALMPKLDYLSTVSGGGYMGSWMMAWVYRNRSAPSGPAWAGAWMSVVKALAGKSDVTGGDPEPQPVRHLRSYTSYLAPDLGLTLDTFALVAIILRNLIVNWVMLVPALFALIAMIKVSGFLLTFAEAHLPRWDAPVLFSCLSGHDVLAIAITLLFLVAALAAAAALPSHSSVRYPAFLRRCSIPFFLGAVIAGSWLLTVSVSAVGSLSPSHAPALLAWLLPLKPKFIVAIVGYAMLSISIWLSYSKRANELGAAGKSDKFWVALAALGAAALVSLMASWLLLTLQQSVYPVLLWGGHSTFLRQHATEDRLFLVFALPLVLLIVLTVTTLYCAMMGIYEQEEDREWWVRCGGALLGFILFWIACHTIGFYGQDIWKRIVAGVAGLALGLFGSLAGSSAGTAGKTGVKSSQLGAIGKFLEKHDLVLPVVGGAAIFLIGMGVVAAEEAVRQLLLCPTGTHWWNHELGSAGMMFLICGLLALAMNFAININLFSLHGMYRMRLMRAFLGASNVFRHPNPFTNFDPKDTPREEQMPCSPGAPMHLLNATLNLTGTKNAAWRQRRAEGFSFSPVACGGWRIGYVPTPNYGGSKGLTLATAMAISGAAANPNMGYQSSPVLSLLMTFFNLRLGCWLPNPARPTPKGPGASNDAFFRKSGPSFALWPLFAEALALTDDTYRWVELTDGGHFEDLALYEMVLRRVKHIVLVDAGADPTFGFEDLGNAIRKIYIDLGIPINFEKDLKMSAGPNIGNSYCAVARIDYGCVDPLLPGQDMCGYLVYIKAGLNGEEPADILQYARTHKSFPHETTADQFFTESQFESYRHLGSYAIDCITAGSTANQGTMREFRSLAERYWAASSKTPGDAAKSQSLPPQSRAVPVVVLP